MNQSKVAEFIKEIRKKSHLNQEKFGEKYGVSYQAVSKWENGKNLPDISILKEMCQEFDKDINELLETNVTSKTNNKTRKKTTLIIIITIILLIILSIAVLKIVQAKNKETFEFKTIKTTCKDFELYGSIAYDKSKTSIYISNITYCGAEDTKKYKKIECTLYENDNNTKTKIDNYLYDKQDINLKDFLKKVKFNVEHYSKTCKMYKKNGLLLEIKATEESGTITLFTIPLEFNENCK